MSKIIMARKVAIMGWHSKSPDGADLHIWLVVWYIYDLLDNKNFNKIIFSKKTFCGHACLVASVTVHASF